MTDEDIERAIQQVDGPEMRAMLRAAVALGQACGAADVKKLLHSDACAACRPVVHAFDDFDAAYAPCLPSGRPT